MFKKKIAVYTGSRSDYEILRPLIFKLKNSHDIKLFVGPHHFQKKFGNTFKLIKKDKLKICYKCLTNVNYNNVDINKFIQDSIFKYKRQLIKTKPDLVLILGDRYEVLSFVIASFFLNLKICHLHGGEVTHGSFDDTIRHMISKMSDYHFVTNDKYKVDIFLGIGGGPEGVLAAAALDSFNCSFQGRFLFKTEDDKRRARNMGIIDLSKKYELNEIVSGDSIFCATGITSGDLVSGIKIEGKKFISETLVTHKSSGLKKVIKHEQNVR